MIISLYWLLSINQNLKCFFSSKTTKNRNNFVAGFKFMYLIYNPGGNECLLTYIICLFEYMKGCFSHEMQLIDYILILILSHLLDFFQDYGVLKNSFQYSTIHFYFSIFIKTFNFFLWSSSIDQRFQDMFNILYFRHHTFHKPTPEKHTKKCWWIAKFYDIHHCI